MDDLDFLLHELHQANEEILRRSEACGPSSASPAPTPHISTTAGVPTETEIDPVPHISLSSSNHFDSSNGFSRFQSEPQRNLYELDEMLKSLDPSDYTDLVPDTMSGSANPLNSRTELDNTERNSLHVRVEQAPGTKIAADKASAELDDLLTSLDNYKLGKQIPETPVNQPNELWSNNDQHDPSAVRASSIQPSFKPDNSDCSSSSSSRLQRRQATRVCESYQNDNFLNHPESSSSPADMLSHMVTDLSNEFVQQGAITSSRGICAACEKPIVGMLISALDRDWHPDHFICTNCSASLVRADFYERDHQPYCVDCHTKLYSPICSYCSKPIIDKCMIALDRTWHPEHFFCHLCHRGFDSNATVHEHGSNVFCPPCYLQQFGPRCAKCDHPIADSYITALGFTWHRACFVCQDCSTPLTGSNFHELDGRPYCSSDYYRRRGLICVVCSKSITGKCVNALGRRYHPKHFTCAYCLQPLQTGTFKEHSNKPYCHQCFAQLFS